MHPQRYVKERQGVIEANLTRFYSTSGTVGLDRDDLSIEQRLAGLDLTHFYNNFFVTDLRFWRSVPVVAYLTHLKEFTSFRKPRWAQHVHTSAWLFRGRGPHACGMGLAA